MITVMMAAALAQSSGLYCGTIEGTGETSCTRIVRSPLPGGGGGRSPRPIRATRLRATRRRRGVALTEELTITSGAVRGGERPRMLPQREPPVTCGLRVRHQQRAERGLPGGAMSTG